MRKAAVTTSRSNNRPFSPLSTKRLSCSDVNSDRISCRASMHANSATVNCLTCHSIYASEQPASPSLLAKSSSCHTTRVATSRTHTGSGLGAWSAHHAARPTTVRERRVFRSRTLTKSPVFPVTPERRATLVFQYEALAAGDGMTCHPGHRERRAADVTVVPIPRKKPLLGETRGPFCSWLMLRLLWCYRSMPFSPRFFERP